MAWTNVEFPYASQLTATKMAQLQANFAAIANADTGAPSFVTAAFNSGVVKQGNLLTATASGSVTVGDLFTESSYTLTGGAYSWWTASADATCIFANNDTAAGVIGFQGPFSTGATFYVDERYVQASPPYNIGDGDIPVFAFLLFNKKKALCGVSVAVDPPWAYNGPTCIVPDVIVSGRSYRLEKFIGDRSLPLALLDKTIRYRYARGDIQEDHYAVEIDHAWKNSDMALVPHPFRVEMGMYVAMLNPFASLSMTLRDMCLAGDSRAARELVHERVSFGAGVGQSNFKVPPGVLTCDVD